MSAPKAKFIMGVHSHQPVDNFGSVFEKAYEKAYKPFIDVLERHPGIKTSMHYSGSLLDWISGNRPEFMHRIKSLVEKKQVELLTGGYFEPILTVVPENDAKGQINMLTDKLISMFNARPRGLWLTERVWSPALKKILGDVNVAYTVMDDFHFKRSGVAPEDIYGRYLIKGSDNLSAFASIKKLRYSMPFNKPEAAINFMKNLSEEGKKVFVFADDGEKFGLWPHTHEWVYKKGWLDKFFSMIEEEGSLESVTFGEALDGSPALGEIDVPDSSYDEMMQWSGGNFNNFFEKYSESDMMRKRMLYLSRSLNEREKNKDKNASLDAVRMELYKAQSNCAYWHGVFGGIYIDYLRKGVYSHIIKGENILSKPSGAPEAERLKLSDGRTSQNVIKAENDILRVFFDIEKYGSLFEIDHKGLLYNACNTMTRREEPYHRVIRERGAINAKGLEKLLEKNENINLYSVLGIKERGVKKYLEYDKNERHSLLCYINGSLLPLRGNEIEEGDEKITVKLKHDGDVRIKNELKKFSLEKCVILEKNSGILIKINARNLSLGAAAITFAIEFNWSIEDAGFMKAKEIRGLKEIALVDRYNGMRINHSFKKDINLKSYPVYTVNESEGGLVKNFQEIAFLFYRKINLKSNETFSEETNLKISK